MLSVIILIAMAHVDSQSGLASAKDASASGSAPRGAKPKFGQRVEAGGGSWRLAVASVISHAKPGSVTFEVRNIGHTSVKFSRTAEEVRLVSLPSMVAVSGVYGCDHKLANAEWTAPTGPGSASTFAWHASTVGLTGGGLALVLADPSGGQWQFDGVKPGRYAARFKLAGNAQVELTTPAFAVSR